MVCRLCGEDKPQELFPFRKDTQRYRTECKSCRYKKDIGNKTKEERKKYKSEYYIKNKESVDKKNMENYRKKKVLLTPEEKFERLRALRKGKPSNQPVGFKHSEEAKKTMGQKKIGKYRGKSNPRYKNGLWCLGNNPRRDDMVSREYKEWRLSVFKRDNYTCQKCGQIGEKLNSHHIQPWIDFPDLRYDINNGVTLCVKCHHIAHRKVKEKQN